MIDATRLEIASAARLLRAGHVTSVELTRVFLERIEKLEPRLNAIYTLTADHALQAAEKADSERAQGRDRGPLHGIPLAVKDLFETSFAPTSAGLTHRRDVGSSVNSAAVARLDSAGAVILAKLGMTEGAYVDHNPAWPVPKNPWNADYWAGLSSSGSGVAVAARLCLGAMGSDTGGSIRLPSAACGITGLKPTFGRVSGRGAVALADRFDHFGPMTVSAADAALMLDALAGRDHDDARTAHAPDAAGYAAALADGATGLRIGVDRDLLEREVNPQVAEGISAALAVLEAAGACLLPVRLPDREGLLAAFSPLFAAGALAVHRQAFAEHEAKYGGALAAMLRVAGGLSSDELELAEARCGVWNAELRQCLAGVDMIALPVLTEPVPQIGTMSLGNGSGFGTFTIPFNVSGSPTINFPVGIDNAGLPLSMQLVGPHWREADLLRAAHAFQSATDWHRRLPPLAA